MHQDFKIFVISVASGVISGIITGILTILLNKEGYVDWVIFISIVYIVLICSVAAYIIIKTKNINVLSQKATTNKESLILSELKNMQTILYKYASHSEELKIINTEGKELIGIHAGNFLWKEVTDAICKGMGLKHLRYSNIGTAYHLCDIENGKNIEIPTDNRIESKIEESGLRNGQILAVIENS